MNDYYEKMGSDDLELGLTCELQEERKIELKELQNELYGEVMSALYC